MVWNRSGFGAESNGTDRVECHGIDIFRTDRRYSKWIGNTPNGLEILGMDWRYSEWNEDTPNEVRVGGPCWEVNAPVRPDVQHAGAATHAGRPAHPPSAVRPPQHRQLTALAAGAHTRPLFSST
jgi:hypothetical protein